MIAVSLAGKMANVCVYILISTTTHLGIAYFFRTRSRKLPPSSPKVPVRLCLTVISIKKIIYTQGNFKAAYAYKYVKNFDGLFDGLFDRQKNNGS